MQENAHKMKPKQEQLIALLLAGNTFSVIATALDINPSTITRWLALPHVKEAYADARRESFNQAMNSLAVYALDAVDTVHSIMTSVEYNTANSTRLRAAQLILEHGIKVHEIQELEQQVEELSQLVKTQQEEKRR